MATYNLSVKIQKNSLKKYDTVDKFSPTQCHHNTQSPEPLVMLDQPYSVHRRAVTSPRLSVAEHGGRLR